MELKRNFLLFCYLVLVFMSSSVIKISALPQQEARVPIEQSQVINREIKYERMDIEVNDYPGSGANNRHDPKSPGIP